MATNDSAPLARRALLTAAAGSVGAIAASAALPALTLAHDPDDLALGTDNATTATTSITQATDGQVAFKAHNETIGAAGLIGSSGDETDAPTDTSYTGVFGWSPTSGDDSFFGTGVWGSGGEFGVYGDGGLAGVVATGGSVGVLAAGDTDGVIAYGGPGGTAVVAAADTADAVGLEVFGKVKFSRSGRSTVAKNHSTVKVKLAGTTSGSRVFAVLHSNRSGRYVRAVVPTTGSFTIYLNAKVTSTTYVAWFVLN